MSAPCIMLVAAEPSGDLLGAALATSLRQRLAGDVRLVGVGGPRMAAAGVAAPFNGDGLAVLGVFNALLAYPRVVRGVRRVTDLARREQPRCVVLIDSWGFTLRVARALRKRDPSLTLIKYVGPQVWATRPGRARTLARTVDLLLAINRFDAPAFEREGLAVRFVGAPVLAGDPGRGDMLALRARIGAAPDDQVLLILPGSRSGEIDRLCAPFGKAAAILRADRPGLHIVVAAAEAMSAKTAARVAAWRVPVHLVPTEAERFAAMRLATVALACSGTVTTEVAMAGCPVVVAYRLDPLTAVVARRLIRTPYITLFNVAARRFIAPELVQEACTGPALAAAVAALLDSRALREGQVSAQREALGIMRGGIADPVGAAAEAVIEALETGRRRP